MAALDVKVHDEIFSFFWHYVCPLLIVMVLLNVCRNYFNTLYLKVNASIVDRFAKVCNKKMGWRKEKLFSEINAMAKEHSRAQYVLEIGAGSGANFQYLPDDTNLICVDPNPHFESYLSENRDKFPNVKFKDFIVGSAEDLSLVPNNSIDAVICTFVLCTVQDVQLSLAEIKRILRPGGKFFYMEHVAADEKTLTWKVQCLVNPLHKRVADNCQVTLRTWLDIENAGFEKVKHERFLTKLGLNLFTFYPVLRPMLIGVATK